MLHRYTIFGNPLKLDPSPAMFQDFYGVFTNFKGFYGILPKGNDYSEEPIKMLHRTSHSSIQTLFKSIFLSNIASRGFCGNKISPNLSI